MSKYENLVQVLDELRKEAPSEYKRYYPHEDDLDKLNYARSLTYIHLFLKVKFGILDFHEREKNITDGSQDGGVDGYYIDDENKRIYFIQSKFRINKKNFEEKSIGIGELYAMELDRITHGKTSAENGTDYNGKIQALIQKIQGIEDYVKYKEIVILLANIKDKYDNNKLKTLTVFPYEIFNHQKCYTELLFPVVSGTYYNPSELKISINVSNYGGSNRIDYYADTNIKECNITVLFVPTIEVGRILYKFKNSILKYNPRSFLELASGSVNQHIKESITNVDTKEVDPIPWTVFLES